MLDHLSAGPAAIRTHFGAIFVSLDMGRSKWIVTSLSPETGERMSQHTIPAGDVGGLLALFADLRHRAKARSGLDYPVVTIQEAGLDGFWLHRVLEQEGIESHVVDAASIATPRRRRRAKTDKIDGEALLRALLAFKRGEPRVCAMVVVPSLEEEDRRRLCRERQTLLAERGAHTNRIKGLLFAQGVFDYEPIRRDRRKRLDDLRTGNGRPLPPHLRTQIKRELDRLELLLDQIKAVEVEQQALLASQVSRSEPDTSAANVVAMLLAIKGIGTQAAAVLWVEGLCRTFANRRQVASYAGLAATPWRSGAVVHEQGLSKAGNPRLRTLMVQLAWLWLRHQPQSELAKWFRARGERGRKGLIVALVRKLLVALWKYVAHGITIEGAVMKPAV
ncbi:transposase [Rhodopseudomonas thermotolerans]|uniref:Transposase n=2 Tax=Rhodopseudomonas TaxID=1073 RepID=A0A336JM81_9BRAD|nr:MULTISPECIES: IS110 family transposase [Rhodopseudomonas]RED38470.1 transposase [Rhodopseudomonas pentothenatexigens]REG06055.1 transposase [Rhodopseudomonas thermotolerans]SSW89923.1 transposase [Rhodopseudomonas pentothenatexigens]